MDSRFKYILLVIFQFFMINNLENRALKEVCNQHFHYGKSESEDMVTV
jgi:hypothetical protein